MEQELYNLIDSSLAGYKVYPSVLPLNANYPCARYILLNDNIEQTKDSSLRGLARFQLDIYSRDTIGGISAYGVLNTLQDAIKIALNGYTGTIIREIRIRDVNKDYEEEIEAHISRIEFDVYHK